MNGPETIYAWRYDDKTNQGQWTRALNPNVEASFIRADIADARVAAAYEAAAAICDEERHNMNMLCTNPPMSAAAVGARNRIRALTLDDAKAALEAVRREERQFGIPVAAALAAAISLLERGGKQAAASDKMFDQMLIDYQRALDDYRALIDKETTE